MANRHPGLTQPIATSYLEAARVCLDRHHTSPTEFAVQNGTETVSALVEWEATDERSRGAWANHIDATEAGAYACALAAVELTGGLVAIRRAETGTGADYYIGPPGQPIDDLEGACDLKCPERIGGQPPPSLIGSGRRSSRPPSAIVICRPWPEWSASTRNSLCYSLSRPHDLGRLPHSKRRLRS